MALAALVFAGAAACAPEPEPGAERTGREAPGERAAESSPAGRSARAGTAPRPITGPLEVEGDLDLVLVTIDTLRADSLGFAGHPEVSTPTLDRLAATGRVFPRAHAHNVVTLPSHANILTGLYPYQHGIRDNSGFVLGDDIPTLATLLGDRGWATGAFVAAFPLDARFGLDRGFDLYDDRVPSGAKPTEFVMPEVRGDEVVRRALTWWKSQAGKKRFLWLHLYDPHAPYVPPEPFRSRHPDNPYLGEVEAVDHYLKPLLEPFLEGREEPALVAVTSDHGEALGEHGELTHGLFAYEPTLAVPLVLWGPGLGDEGGRPVVDHRSAGHVDLLPTLLQAVGVEAPEGLPGRSLLAPAEEERDLYFEALSTYLNRGWAPLHGMVRGGHKAIRLPLPELYDLEADPAEAENLIDSERRTANTLLRSIPEEALRPPEQGQVTAEEAAQLRSLGYLASGGGGGDPAAMTAADDPKTLIEMDRKLHRIVALYTERRLDEAARLAREVVAERPSMALGWERLSTVLREQGQVAEAVRVLKEAMAQGVDHPTVVRQLGLGLAEIGEGAEAVRVLTPLTGDDDDLETLNALGVAQYSAGRLPAARQTFGRVLARDPDNPKALESLASVALAAGNPPEAEARAREALAANNQLPNAWNSLGVALQLQGDTPGALEAWERAWRLDPNLFDALYNLGLTAAASGRPDLARRALTSYLETAPADRFRAERGRARQVLTQLGGPR